MFHYIASHWAISSGALALVASEILPFLPTKYNGLAHAIFGLLGLSKKT